jgi:hypothetical protein
MQNKQVNFRQDSVDNYVMERYNMDMDEETKKDTKKTGIKACIGIAVCSIIAIIMDYLVAPKLQGPLRTIILTVLLLFTVTCLAIIIRMFLKCSPTIIELLVVIAVVALLLVIFRPTIHVGHDFNPIVPCKMNLTQLYFGLILYDRNNEEHWPAEANWCDFLIEKYELAEDILKCMNAKQGPHSYAVNKNAFGLKLEDLPGDMVLMFESVPGKNQVGELELVTLENHDGKGFSVLFADGSTKFILCEDIDKLKWKPEK